jgi:hypothetical protein
MTAVELQQYEIIEFLLDRNADLEARNYVSVSIFND